MTILGQFFCFWTAPVDLGNAYWALLLGIKIKNRELECAAAFAKGASRFDGIVHHLTFSVQNLPEGDFVENLAFGGDFGGIQSNPSGGFFAGYR